MEDIEFIKDQDLKTIAANWGKFSELEIRFGTFFYNQHKSFLSSTNFYNLLDKYKDLLGEPEVIISTSELQNNLRLETIKNKQIFTQKDKILDLKFPNYGFHLVLSSELPLQKSKAWHPTLIREKTRYRFDFGEGYFLDLTKVKGNEGFISFEVELEIPKSGSKDEINEYINIILRNLFNTELILTAYDKITPFLEINTILGYPATPNLLYKNLPQLANLHLSHLLGDKVWNLGRGQVTIKIDGMRKLMWITPDSIYLLMSYDTISKIQVNRIIPPRYIGCLFELELYEDTLYFYDTLIYQGKSCINLNHRDRLGYAWDALNIRNYINYKVELKEFFPFHNSSTFYKACNWIFSKVLSQEYPFKTDGLVITPDLASTQQLKWKPKEKLTIDFLYNDKHLYVGLNELFKHYTSEVNFPEAKDNTIVEITFDKGIPIYIKNRYDKPAPNSSAVAEDVWDSLENYVSEETVRGKKFDLINLLHSKITDYLLCLSKPQDELNLDLKKPVANQIFDTIYSSELSLLYSNSKIKDLVKLLKTHLSKDGYFFCLSLDGNRISQAMKKKGYFQKNYLNLKQINAEIKNDKLLYNKKEYNLLNLLYLHDLLLANGFKKIEFEAIPWDTGLNPEELVFNSFFSYMIFKKSI